MSADDKRTLKRKAEEDDDDEEAEEDDDDEEVEEDEDDKQHRLYKFMKDLHQHRDNLDQLLKIKSDIMYKKNSALDAVDDLLLEDKDEPSPAASTYLECEVDKYDRRLKLVQSAIDKIQKNNKMSTVKITESVFGVTKNQNEITKYTLSTSDGFEVALINYGAIIQSIRQPDKQNQLAEVTLGYDDLQGYVDDEYYFGCIVGRVTNRIKNARFELEKNFIGKHHLHGVFNERVWDSSTENGDTVVFKYQSPDGEDGYPGRVDATIKYTVTNDHRLIMDFHATTTKPTPINMNNHVYFNLGGDTSGTIRDEKLLVLADKYLPFDDELIPTGEIASVENTPFDFRKLTTIGERMNESFDGYDMMFIVDGEGNRPFGKLVDEKSGRAITIQSTQKGLQFYTGNFLNNVNGHNDAIYSKHGALCLETQNYSDSVNNQPKFPSIILRPGEEYHEQTTFHFHLE